MKDCRLMRIDHREEVLCRDQMLSMKENKWRNVVISALGEAEEFFVARIDTADFGTGFRGASGEQQEWKKEECIPDAASRLDIGWQFYRAIRDD